MDSRCTGDGTSSRGIGWIGKIYVISISNAVFLRIPILKACALTRVVDQLGSLSLNRRCTGTSRSTKCTTYMSVIIPVEAI